jgi:hypothetical protein
MDGKIHFLTNQFSARAPFLGVDEEGDLGARKRTIGG